jgi:DamX protein
MSALTKNINISDDNTSVTKISAQARIDYILRFSKQAILVIDESVEQNTTISNQLLANLPEQHNVAYVALSSQFNNIQIRCRIIEQLYTGELFDPEISLAVSVINLAKKSKQSISIVLDRAQHLSLQISHELTQLALIAKKSNLTVNVVMFGSLQAGRNIAINKSLFDNKLSLLSSQSGQLLSPTSTMFKKSSIKWSFSKRNKWLLSAAILLILITALVIKLLQLDSFNFAKPITALSTDNVSLTKTLSQPQTMVIESKNASQSNSDITTDEIIKTYERAVPADIYLSLVSPKTVVIKKNEPLPATSFDIISAITTNETDTLIETQIKNAMNVLPQEEQSAVTTSIAAINKTNSLQVDNDFYADKTGYVIQLSAFSDLALPQEYSKALDSIEYHIYQRLLNDQPLIVFTSKVYAEKSAAQAALSTLPVSLLSRQPWIKPTSIVNNEINAFQSSQ